WKGSSTIGVKKSTVCTSARSGAIRNTPASSAVEVPTSRSACTTGGSARRIFDRSAGPSLPAQPAARARVVNRKSSGRVRAPLSPSAMRGTLATASPPVQGDSWPPAPVASRGSAAELADVAYAQGHAGPVAPVEEGDRELAARADQVAEDGGRDLAVRAAVRLDDGLCLVGRGAGVMEVGRDARHLLLG